MDQKADMGAIRCIKLFVLTEITLVNSLVLIGLDTISIWAEWHLKAYHINQIADTLAISVAPTIDSVGHYTTFSSTNVGGSEKLDNATYAVSGNPANLLVKLVYLCKETVYMQCNMTQF